MPSLEDVKVFARQHSDLDGETLEARVAKEFGMSREEAARVVRDIRSEEGVTTDAAPVVPGETVAVPAGALIAAPNVMGSSTGNSNPAAAPLAATEMDREGREREREVKE